MLWSRFTMSVGDLSLLLLASTLMVPSVMVTDSSSPQLYEGETGATLHLTVDEWHLVGPDGSEDEMYSLCDELVQQHLQSASQLLPASQSPASADRR